MLSKTEKYKHALALRRAINSKKDAQAEIDAETSILTQYVKETGDKVFRWNSGLSLTYVSGCDAKPTIDAKIFLALAPKYMSKEDFEACAKQATKMAGARRASFR